MTYNDLEEAKAQLKRTLSGRVKENEVGVVTVDLSDDDLKRFWEGYLDIKENERGSPLQRAKKALKKTLSRQQIDQERL
jgi:hypothetical protein